MNKSKPAGTRSPESSREPGGGLSPRREEGTDLIVVGTGVAGLRAAIEASGAGLDVVLLAKDPASESNTDKAQGGVAVALSDEDRVGLHFQDTVAAGAGLCDEEAVRILVEEGPQVITQLIAWGATFDRDGSHLAFTREGAHSARRVLHAGGDATGQEILRALIGKACSETLIRFRPSAFTVDLVVEAGRCAGLVFIDGEGRLRTLRGRVLLATGGCGQVFRETTNPPQATGDGIAMAWRAGAWVRDMEFVQFHPTALAVEGAPRFLLSEALRGEGGVLLDLAGHRFMRDVDPRRAELAPRDVVSRAIAERMERTGDPHVLLDMTSMDAGFLKGRFPGIHATCLRYGIDIAKTPIPVSPSAHYMMGGVATDHWGRSSIAGLYAAGEASCTGVHGANRLASNSLLEGLVYGARAGKAVVADAAEGAWPSWTPAGSVLEGPADDGPTRVAPHSGGPADPDRLAREIRGIAWKAAGLSRDAGGLRRALDDLQRLGRAGRSGEPPSRAAAEAGNLLDVAWLIARAALAREESRGAHFRSDHPRADDARWRVSLLARRGEGPRVHPVGAGPSG